MAKRRAAPRSTPIQRSRRTSSVEKALYHNSVGVGRSKVVRPFVGSTDKDLDAISKFLQAQLDARLAKAGR